MKQLNLFATPFLIIVLSFLFQGCCTEESYTSFYYEPVYISKDSIEKLVEVQKPREIIQAGGIYYKSGYVYVLEKGGNEHWEYDSQTNQEVFYANFKQTGIHIIDDRNPSKPVHVAFIQIPGVNGMAAKGETLYADSYADLLVFDISNATSPVLNHRMKGVYKKYNSYYDASMGLIAGYNKLEGDVIKNKECRGLFSSNDDDVTVDAVAYSEKSATTSDNGVAGSMARFVTVGDLLYSIDYSELHLFDISQPKPTKISDIEIGMEIETIFPHENNLYFGASSGMYIYDNSNPKNPEFLSKYEHITSCDPVVVKGNYAYVTLRSGSTCQGFTNQLDIVNVANPAKPFLEKTYPMKNPHGLSISNDCLYICEGDDGLKRFTIDPKDPTTIQMINSDSSFHAFDVITLPNLLMVVGNDGFYQYAENCGTPLSYLGKIEF